MTLFGSSVPKPEAEDLVQGVTRYVGDMRLPGLVFGRCVRAGVPHARLNRVITERAAALPGVDCVLTSADIPGVNSNGALRPDQPLLAADRIRCEGDIVAVVFGRREVLEEAASLVKLEYDPLPLVLDPEAAILDDAPKLYDSGNVTCQYDLLKGDPDKAFASAPVVISGRYYTPFQEHAYLEPEAALAVPDGSRHLTVHAAAQSFFRVRDVVAKALAWPAHCVTVLGAPIGGTFGGKSDPSSHLAALAALGAVRCKRPAVIIASRADVVLGGSCRHAAIIDYRTAATEDGRLLARDINIILDGGAYSSVSPFVAVKAMVHSCGPYRVPNVRSKVIVAYTNKPYSGACRGFGVPQVTFASERQLDELARKLEMDPVQLRLANCLRVGDETGSGQVLRESVGLEKAIRQAAEEAGWTPAKETRTGGPAAPRSGSGKLRGLGVACMYQGISQGAEGVDAVEASCRLLPDGSVLVFSGMVEMGQGITGVFSQIVADALGTDPSMVRVARFNTDTTHDSGPTVASRGTTMGGRAVLMAATAAREALVRVAARVLEAEPDQIELGNGAAYIRSDPGSRVSHADLARRLGRSGEPVSFTHLSKTPPAAFDPVTHQGDIYMAYGFGAHVCEVEVDPGTGVVEILRHYAVHDVGKVVNPAALRGQIHGATVMGAGLALCEELSYGPSGRLLNPDFRDYILPSAVDAPEAHISFVEEPCSWGPHGAKGVAEYPVSAAAAAIANAVAAAAGIDVRELPLSPDRVLKMLEQNER